MKRARQAPECYVSAKCAIFCQSPEGEWLVHASETDLPSEILQEYNNCRRSQVQRFSQALQLNDTAEEDFVGHLRPIKRDDYELRERACRDEPRLLRAMEDPETVRLLLQEMLNIDEVRFARFLGMGGNGMVFEICNPAMSSTRFVVKIDRRAKNLDAEAQMQRDFHIVGLAPEPVGLYENVLIMGKVDGVLGEMLLAKRSTEFLDRIVFSVIDLIYRMCDHNLAHRDMHWSNIGFQFDIESRDIHMVLIDFGTAIYGCDPELELSQLIRTCYSSNYEPTNMEYLRQQLTIVFETNFGDAPTNFETWTKHYTKLFIQSSKDWRETKREIHQALASETEEELPPTHAEEIEEYNL
jgi:predicted Ser/Thr protein kinase